MFSNSTLLNPWIPYLGRESWRIFWPSATISWPALWRRYRMAFHPVPGTAAKQCRVYTLYNGPFIACPVINFGGIVHQIFLLQENFGSPERVILFAGKTLGALVTIFLFADKLWKPRAQNFICWKTLQSLFFLQFGKPWKQYFNLQGNCGGPGHKFLICRKTVETLITILLFALKLVDSGNTIFICRLVELEYLVPSEWDSTR